MYLLDGAIRHYAWGSHEALAAIRGDATPSDHPEAEMWFGTHPGDPALCAGDDDTQPRQTLRQIVQAHPEDELGADVHRRFSGELPFLLKLLAAAEPLSLQAHPSKEQAESGYARENHLGIPFNAPHRNYHDDNHKPELIVALTTFHALAGFRPPARTLDLFDALGVMALEPYVQLLRAELDATGIRALMTTLITLPRKQLKELIDYTAEAAQRLVDSDSSWSAEAKTYLDLVEEYGVDAGALCALLLNRVTLQPGESLFLSAGILHAYLAGTGVEIMANSDNVLRGGLTPKHVDVPELMQVLSFDPVEDPQLHPRVLPSPTAGAQLWEYHTPVPEFTLTRIHLDPHTALKIPVAGPCIVLVAEGPVDVRQLGASASAADLTVPAGQAVWVGSQEDRPTLLAGSVPSHVFVASVPTQN